MMNPQEENDDAVNCAMIDVIDLLTHKDTQIKELHKQLMHVRGSFKFHKWCKQCLNNECKKCEYTEKGPFIKIPSEFLPTGNPFEFLPTKPNKGTLAYRNRQMEIEIARLQKILEDAIYDDGEVKFDVKSLDDKSKFFIAMAPYCPKCGVPSNYKKDDVYVCVACENRWTLEWYFKTLPKELDKYKKFHDIFIEEYDQYKVEAKCDDIIEGDAKVSHKQFDAEYYRGAKEFADDVKKKWK